MTNIYYFYPGVIILGLLSSYTDFKYNIIKNSHLVWVLIYGILIHSYIFISGKNSLPLNTFLLNIFISIIIAYSLYIKRLWAAGDAKLFITLSFLTPSLKYTDFFKLPALTLFININILSLAYLVLFEFKNIFINFKNREKGFFLEKIHKFLNSFTITFSISWVIWLLIEKLKFTEPIINIGIIYIFYFLISRGMKYLKSYKPLLIFLLVIGIIFRFLLQPQVFLSLSKISTYIIRMIKFTLLFNFFDLLFIDSARENNGSPMSKKIFFAPFIFLGTITIESPIVYFVFKSLKLFLR